MLDKGKISVVSSVKADPEKLLHSSDTSAQLPALAKTQKRAEQKCRLCCMAYGSLVSSIAVFFVCGAATAVAILSEKRVNYTINGAMRQVGWQAIPGIMVGTTMHFFLSEAMWSGKRNSWGQAWVKTMVVNAALWTTAIGMGTFFWRKFLPFTSAGRRLYYRYPIPTEQLEVRLLRSGRDCKWASESPTLCCFLCVERSTLLNDGPVRGLLVTVFATLYHENVTIHLFFPPLHLSGLVEALIPLFTVHMGKDKVGYRKSRKFPLSNDDVEHSIGINAFRCTDPATAASSRLERGSRRPTALMKWSFDDFCVEEVFPCKVAVTPEDTETSCVLEVVSEGIPTPTITRALRNILPAGVLFHFLSPIDFLSSSRRFVWIRERKITVCQSLKQTNSIPTRDGIIYLGEVIEIPVPPSQKYFPLNLLPDFTYTVVLRNIDGCLADILTPLKTIRSAGVINYAHIARHGMGLLNAFNDARHILHREYHIFLKHYIQSLSEGTPNVMRELTSVMDLLDISSCRTSDWRNALRGMQHALEADRGIFQFRNSGLYYPHHQLLHDFMVRAADLFPKHNDKAVVIHETLNRLLQAEKMRSISDIGFNTMASYRWNRFGPTVAVGDLVVDSHWRGDVFEACNDHIGGWITSGTQKEWVSTVDRVAKPPLPRIKIIQSSEEARGCDINNVVLPLFGKEFDTIQIPENASAGAFQSFISELSVQGFPFMDAAPRATYRHLVRPASSLSFYICDEERGWDWIENDASEELKNLVYRDQENILRIKSRLLTVSNRNVVCRPGVRTEEGRKHLLKPARRNGMTCVVRATLPRGTPITSLLREFVVVTTLSPAGILRLLR
eukprot:gene5310-3812_t